MRRLLAVGLITVLLVALIPASGTAQSNAPTTPQKITTSQEFDDVEFHIFVYKNSADALWTFRYEKTLNNKQEREQFKEFSNRFNSSDTEMYKSFRENAVNLTRTANNRTKRKMAASNFSKNAYINQEGIDGDTTRGVVEMSFTWSSFAYGSGNVTNIGDVFKGGLYLGKDQTLVINHADGMTFEKVRPTKGVNMSGDTLAESSSVSWTGPREFTDQHPMVKFSSPPQSSSTMTTTTTNNSSVPPGGGNQGSDSRSPMMLFIAAVLVLIGLVAVFMWRQGSLGSLSSGRSTPGGGGGGAGGGTVARESNTPPAEPAVSDEELLTDEARVKKLLRENGGRMKQVNIVDETGWSKSKVSMLLSEMEEEGDISKLRVGRENIISLDGHEPDAAGSPLDR